MYVKVICLWLKIQEEIFLVKALRTQYSIILRCIFLLLKSLVSSWTDTVMDWMCPFKICVLKPYPHDVTVLGGSVLGDN